MATPDLPSGIGGPNSEGYGQLLIDSSRKFRVFSGPAETSKREIVGEQLAVIDAIFVDSSGEEAEEHGSVHQPHIADSRIEATYLERYGRIVSPLQEIAGNLESDSLSAFEEISERLRLQTLSKGYKSVAAFALFTASRDDHYGGLFVPRTMTDHSEFGSFGVMVAATSMPDIEAVRQRIAEDHSTWRRR